MGHTLFLIPDLMTKSPSNFFPENFQQKPYINPTDDIPKGESLIQPLICLINYDIFEEGSM